MRKRIKILHERIDRIQKKVDVNAKFVIGAGAVLATLIAVLQVVPPIVDTIDKHEQTSMIDATAV